MTYPLASNAVDARRPASPGTLRWRSRWLRDLAPGLLAGITTGDWLRLLCDNGFKVSPRFWLRALTITFQSAFNSFESWCYGSHVEDVTVPPPVFVLGHWRSGTTHLHRLLTVDDRFAYPNSYEALYPHTFVATEAVNARLIEALLPNRRPMDDMEWNIRLPQEDESALCVSSFESPCMGWVFPRRQQHYDRYLTLRGVSRREMVRWQRALLGFLQKLTVKYHRQPVLKSRPQPCRIKLLLELFPKAKFVHIHRDPYVVFQSSRRTFQVNFGLARLQNAPRHDLDDRSE